MQEPPDPPDPPAVPLSEPMDIDSSSTDSMDIDILPVPTVPDYLKRLSKPKFPEQRKRPKPYNELYASYDPDSGMSMAEQYVPALLIKLLVLG